MSGARTHREVELKFRVHGLFEMPDLVAAGVAERATTTEPFEMTAVYHDTDELTLFRWGITLRRREGGKDAGWHMKLPVAGGVERAERPHQGRAGADGSTRDEMHVPLDAGANGSVPPALVEVVSPLLHELPLNPVITLSTLRTPTLLANTDGEDLVEVVDDIVTIRHDGRIISVFREIEVEALDSDNPDARELMRHVSELLIGMGAEPSSVSKAASALGPRTAEPPDIPALPIPGPDDLAVDAIRAILSLHVRHLLMADIGVRRDLPDSVHQMRVAARRLRSALTTFAPLLEEETAATLKEELRWIASELGVIRDTEVMLERLDDHAGELADPADTQRCRDTIDPLLRARLAAARSSALAALRSDRHQQLVDDLMSAAQRPPVVDAAYEPCNIVLMPLVARTWKRLARAIAGLDIDGPSTPWHEARIKAKRARYAAESVAEVFGKPMRRLASSLAEVTEVLGDHQDAHVAQRLLRELAAHPETDGSTGLSLGLLHEFESEVEMRDRFRFKEIWGEARHRARQAGTA